VAVATVVSKLRQQFILPSISPLLGTTDNQFGFKASHGTDQCTFLFKQTASYFVTHGSSAHCAFSDALKAFDRVLRMKLFEKLIQRKVPMCFVRLLEQWCKEQTMQIQLGNHLYEPFHVTNGVRQGGVLSSYLFAVYLDDISTELNNIKPGYYIGEVLLNNLMFADDLCVFCPSVRGLQRILDVCQAYAESHGIIVNCSKTVCMTLKAKCAKSTVTPLLTLACQTVKPVNHYKYLGVLLDNELSDNWHSETTAIPILCSKQAANLFPNVQVQLKMYFFAVKNTFSGWGVSSHCF